jgi:hypothetical protein
MPDLSDSKLQKEDFPREKVERLMDQVWDMQSDALECYQRQIPYNKWKELRKAYYNLYTRTWHIVGESNKYEVSINQTPQNLDTIADYLKKLQSMGLFKVGSDDVLI